MIFSHKGLELGGSNMIGSALVAAPLHENAVGDATEHSQNPDAIVTLHSAPVIVIGNVQALMEAAFDAPTLSIEQEPEQGWQH